MCASVLNFTDALRFSLLQAFRRWWEIWKRGEKRGENGARARVSSPFNPFPISVPSMFFSLIFLPRSTWRLTACSFLQWHLKLKARLIGELRVGNLQIYLPNISTRQNCSSWANKFVKHQPIAVRSALPSISSVILYCWSSSTTRPGFLSLLFVQVVLARIVHYLGSLQIQPNSYRFPKVRPVPPRRVIDV